MRLILVLAIAACFSSCAKKSESQDIFVRCQVIFDTDETGHRINGFWDIDRSEKVSASQCDEIYPTGLPEDIH